MVWCLSSGLLSLFLFFCIFKIFIYTFIVKKKALNYTEIKKEENFPSNLFREKRSVRKVVKGLGFP